MSVNEVINASRQFETALLDRQNRITKAAWCVAFFFGLLAVLAIVAIIIMLPLQHTELELYTLDSQTGRVEYVTRVKERDLSSETVLAAAFAANYVEHREGYNYFALQSDYNTTKQFSSETVKREYLDWFNSPNAPDVVYKKAAYTATIEIISNVHSDATKPDRLAQLRIKKIIRDVATGREKVEFWHIRFTYRYTPHNELTDIQREINPLGFTVTSYQRDKELRKE
ncbi:type IV secretion system protein [Salmonella enterica]|nr:type IV secretion system protein [Salmonella enterica]EAT7575718.1 type IV secretion system protein [Salmonella enterica]EDZ8322528.1 type IV secretion system protein [Salmonella enterica]